MAAGSIVIDLLMKTGSFETDTKRAEKRLKELEREATKVGKAIGLAFVAAAGATALLVKSSIDAADAAIKQAQAVGLTVEAYTELSYAAGLSGVGQDELAGSLTRLARAAKDADDGVKESAEAFAGLGIQVRDADGVLKTTDALLTEVAAKFATLSDGTEKTARATELFGRSGAKLIPLLNGGADGLEAMKKEAAALGIVMSTQMAQAAEQFNDNLSRMGLLVKGFGNDLARQLLPLLNDSAQLLLDVGKASRETGAGMTVAQAATSVLTTTLQALLVAGSNVSFVFQAVGREIGAVAAQIGVIGELLANPQDILQNASEAWRRFNAISTAVKEDGVRARKELDAFEEAVFSLGTGKLSSKSASAGRSESSQVGTLGRTTSSSTSKTPKQTEAERYLESLQRQLQATQDLSVAETVLSDIQAGRLGKVTEAQTKALLGVAQQIDQAKRLQDQLKAEDDQLRQLKASQDALKEAGRAVFEATRTDAEKLSAEIDRLNKLLAEGVISWDTYARAQLDAQKAFDESTKASQKTDDALTEFQKNAAENLQRSFGDTLVDVMNGNFKDIGDGFKKMIDRMVAEAIAAQIVKALFGDKGDGTGALGNVLGTIGNVLFGGGKASGGDVMPNRSYLVGENGPERFVPRTFGTILPAQVATSSNSTKSITVNPVFHLSGPIDTRTQQQIAANVARSVSMADARMN